MGRRHACALELGFLDLFLGWLGAEFEQKIPGKPLARAANIKCSHNIPFYWSTGFISFVVSVHHVESLI
ncbi:hypothetical protein ES703_121128 [subsurface metagenome]